MIVDFNIVVASESWLLIVTDDNRRQQTAMNGQMIGSFILLKEQILHKSKQVVFLIAAFINMGGSPGRFAPGWNCHDRVMSLQP